MPDGSFLFTKNPTLEELPKMYRIALKELGPDVTPLEVVQSVYRYNPIAVWALYRAKDERRASPEIAGFIAYLPLNAAGNAALKAEKLDFLFPDFSLLAKPGENPVSFYLWAMVTPGLGNIGFALIARAIGPNLFERTPIIGRISTQSALDSVKRSSKTKEYADAKLGSIFTLTFPDHYRAQMRSMVVTEGVREPKSRAKPRPKLEAFPVATADDMAKVLAVRSAVFMSEQKCPFEEEFDGNDFSATHILGTVDGQPAAVMRMRYFAEFVKMERLAVAPRYRRTLIARQVIETGIELIRRKGFKKMYAQAQTRLTAFWKHYGFKPVAPHRKFVFSDHEYIEIEADIAPHPDVLTINSDPLVLIRPEGKWDEPGVLDHSALRPPTNPH
jgi:predicted GNAT family N-acyltransferase